MQAEGWEGLLYLFSPSLKSKYTTGMKILLLFKNFLIAPLSLIYVHIINIQKPIRTKKKTEVTIYSSLFT